MKEKLLLAILLNARGAQSGKAVLVDGELPGQEFVDCQRIAAASFFQGKKTTAYGGDNLGLTADNPPFCTGRLKIGNR